MIKINVGISLILIGIYNIHFKIFFFFFLFCGGGVGGAGCCLRVYEPQYTLGNRSSKALCACWH